MARANFAVSSDLRDAFTAAQSESVRFIQLELDTDAESIKMIGTPTGPTGSAEEDFVAMVGGLDLSSVNTILFCMNPAVEGSAAKKWAIVSFVPELSNPRLKMISASSRADIRAQLGTNFFVNEFHASEIEEMNWADFNASSTVDADAAMSHSETMKKQERLESGVDRGHKSAALGVVPFDTTPELTDAITAFPAGDVTYLEARVDMKTEDIHLVSTAATADAAGVAARAPKDEPRLLLVKLADKTVLVLWCPDDAPPRERMVYSTVKAAYSEHLARLGVSVSSSIQASSKPDLESSLQEETAEIKSPVATSFSRPSRPGRGRARLIRKKAAGK